MERRLRDAALNRLKSERNFTLAAGRCGGDRASALTNTPRVAASPHPSTRAITALGYLQEAIAARRASTTMVSNVRDYIVSLRTSPEREFVATL